MQADLIRNLVRAEEADTFIGSLLQWFFILPF